MQELVLLRLTAKGDVVERKRRTNVVFVEATILRVPDVKEMPKHAIISLMRLY